jgi:hypothetical protein
MLPAKERERRDRERALNAPKPDEIPSGVRGNRDEAMTVRQHEPV